MVMSIFFQFTDSFPKNWAIKQEIWAPKFRHTLFA